MNRSALQQQLAQKIGISLLLGSLAWVVILIRGASVVRGQTGNASYDVMFGPLVLHHITKEKTADSFTAAFSFEAGLLWYLLFWVLIGIMLGFVSWRRSQNEHTSGS